MFKFLKNVFKKEEKSVDEEMTADALFGDDKITIDVNCNECPLRKLCSKKGQVVHECENAIELPEYNPKLDTILIIDDNEGMVSFLKDDMEYFSEEGIINLKEVNLLTISGVHAAFTLKLLYEKLSNLNIKWAIIDITLGGSKMTEKGNIKYTGVDAFNMMYSNNSDLEYLFYTGNNLNPYIKSNEKLINQFKKITGGDIKKKILFKTSMDIKTRRDYILKCIFKK